MVFSSALFLFLFLPVFFVVYFLVPYKWKNVWALIGSTVFYAWGGPVFVFVLYGSILADYLISLKMVSSQGVTKKRWLWLGLVLNVGLLAYFKYANFFVENFTGLLELLGMGAFHWTEVALPIGISFFTFQKISYLVDVYRGEKKELRNVVDYALFVILFPQLIAGPIVRFKDIATQIVDRRANLIPEERLLGIYRFIIGLSKKVLIANPMGELADKYFDGVLDPSRGESWVAVLAYTFQIYFDFSGYSDMAIGLGRMMGFKFPENFNFPYISKSITEFWRRWHMTLSSWMRDYLYIPLGGNRVSATRTYLNLWVVFLISGLWHGASWNFVIWGAYHGLWLVLERRVLMSVLEKIPSFIRIFTTFVIAVFGWLVFRVEEWEVFTAYLGAMFTGEGGAQISAYQYTIFAIAIFFSFWAAFRPASKTEASPYETISPNKAVRITVISLLLLVLSSSFIISTDFNPFIYFRF